MVDMPAAEERHTVPQAILDRQLRAEEEDITAVVAQAVELGGALVELVQAGQAEHGVEQTGPCSCTGSGAVS